MDYDSEGRSYYDGDWINNVKHGWGTRQYPTGNIYQGMWFNNIRHGEGTMKWLDRNQMYTGNWENGIQVIIKGSNFHLTFVSADFNFQIRPSSKKISSILINKQDLQASVF